MGDDAHLLWIRDHNFLDMRRDHRRDRGRVSGRFDNDYVILRKLLCESLEKRPAHVDAPQSFELAVVPGDRLGEGAVDIQSDDAHAPSVFVRSKWELAGDTTSTDPRSRRIRESRKGRPCNELGLSAHGLSAACPHLRAPGAPCPRWAHHIARPLPGTGGRRGAMDLIPDNGQVERMNRTIKDDTVKRYLYQTHDQLRTHQRHFVDPDNFARRLKTFRGLTPYEF